MVLSTKMASGDADRSFCEYQRTGSPVALAEVFDALAPELLLVAMHMVRNADQAEEIVQSTFVAAIEAAPRFDPSRQLRPWFVGILANHARRERQRQRRVIDPQRLEATLEPDPADVAQAAEFAEVAADALNQLPHTYREVLTLHWVHGLTATQIAQALGRSPATVKTHLHRGRKILMRLLPAGLTAGLLALATAERGLAAVRAVVVGRAEELAGQSPERVGPGSEGAGEVGRTLPGSGSRIAALFAAGALLGGTLVVVLPLWPRAANTTPAEVAKVEGAKETASPSVDPAGGGGRSPLLPASGSERGLSVHMRYADGSTAAGAWFSLVATRGCHPLLLERWIATDAAGTAHVADCPSGPLRLTGDRGGALEIETVEREVVLTIPRGVDVEGLVLDGDRRPVAGARIFVSRAGILDEGVEVTASDDGGGFTLRSVEAGRCLSAVASGHRPARLHPVRAGEDRTRITLLVDERAVPISGRVKDAAGRPIAGARVMVGEKLMMAAPHDPERAAAWPPPLWLVTDAGGVFASGSLALDPECHVRVRAPGYTMVAGSIRVDPVQGADVDIVLEPGAVLLGRAVDRRGQPVADARVVVRDDKLDRPDLGQHAPLWCRSEGWTDAQGGFRIDGLSPLRMHAIVHGPGQLRASAPIEPRAGETVSWYSVLAEPAGMTGQLHDEHGVPLAGWRIELSGERVWEPVVPATTDAQGRFSIVGCEGGPYRLRCRRPADQWPEAAVNLYPVDAGGVPLDLTVPARMLATARLTGRLVDASELPGTLRLRLADEGQAWCPVPVDPTSGRFASPALPTGRYRLAVGHGDHVAALLGPFELGAGASFDCGETRLEPPGELRVKLAGPDGTVPGSKTGVVSADDGTCFAWFPIEQGRGRVRLWPGTYRFHVRGEIALEGPATITVPTRGRADLALTLPPGIPRRFVVAAPDDGEDLRLDWRCESDGRLLCRWRGFWKRDANAVQETVLCFVPGDYRLVVTDHAGRSATASFTVGAAAAGTDPIRLDLR